MMGVSPGGNPDKIKTRPIRVHICYFWDVDVLNTIVRPLAGEGVEVVAWPTRDDADVVFFSAFNPETITIKGRERMPKIPPGPYQRVFLTGENIRPDMDNCEWAFGFDYAEDIGHPNYMRLPLYAWEIHPGSERTFLRMLAETAPETAEERRARPHFCAFIHRNRHAQLRRWLFRLLSLHRRVDAPGVVQANCPPIGQRRSDKLAFLKTRKFTIAFENSSHPGYVTEKIVDAFQAGSVPVYWGSPRAAEEFNPATFIDFHGEEAKLRRFFRLGTATNLPRPVKALVQSLALLSVALRVIRADRRDAAYQAFFAEPCIADGARRFLDQQPVRDRWQAIFAAARRQTG